MTVRELLKMCTVDRYGRRQGMDEATDADGYREIGLQLNVENVANGGSTLVVEVFHAARNRASDYFSLKKWDGITSATTAYVYIPANSSAGFLRYLRVETAWQTGNSTTTADVEVLSVLKE